MLHSILNMVLSSGSTVLIGGWGYLAKLKEKTMRQTRTKTIQEDIVVCDRCHHEMGPDSKDFELQERIAIRFRGGYGSVFGDGNLVEADICQNCLNEIFGKYLRITEDDPFDPQHKLNDEADKAYQESQLQQILATENFLKNFRKAVQAKQQES